MSAQPAAQLAITNERYQLSQALLAATASLANCTEPEGVLRAICDSFAASSPHIKLAWMRLGNLEADVLQPQYAVGPAARYAQGVQVFSKLERADCPVGHALARWETVAADVTQDCCPVLVAVDCAKRLEAENSHDPCCSGKPGVLSVVGLPVGRKHGRLSGVVALYADQPGYFEAVGTAFFSAFIHLANASLEQCALLGNLKHRASHDALTGVLNRRGTRDCMENELARSVGETRSFSVLLFDVDRFKLVNDRLGHEEGDRVLDGVADTAGRLLRDEDHFGRWGGEEFICVLPEVNREEAMVVAERMRRAIRGTPVPVASGSINVTVSFGVSGFPQDGSSVDKLIAAADAALYQAKQSGRDRCISAELVQQDVFSIGNRLDAALTEQRILPAYQPIVDLTTGKVVAEETLARLISPSGEVIDAGRFIAAASQLQLLHRIDQAIVMQAFTHCAVGMQSGASRIDHFINVSADLLRHTEIVQEMLDAARRYCSGCGELIGDVKPMVIEITERELLSDINAARELLMPFTEFGLRLALDDFGSGYSSYQYLADLPIDFLKIDGSLIKRVNEPKVRAIVQGIQDTASTLGIITVAEFIEDAATESILKEIGVDWGQGYYYGKPAVECQQAGAAAPLPNCRRGAGNSG
jgi:diguanylate cyclase (GGDEF)-like protein